MKIVNWSKSMPPLRQLLYFICVAESGSFGKAAEKLNVCQPPLSRHIKALELHVGATLLLRSAHGITLTDAGQIVLDKAKRIISDVRALADFGEQPAALHLNVGFSRYLDPGWAGELKNQLRATHSMVGLSALWAPSPDLLQLTRTSALDAAIVGVPPEMINEQQLIQVGFYDHVVVVPECIEQSLGAAWELQDLEREILLEQRSAIFPAYSRFLDEAMKRAQFRPRRQTRADEIGVLLSQIANGQGITLLSSTLLKFGYAGAVARSLPVEVSELFRVPVAIAISPQSRLHSDGKLSNDFIEAVQKLVAPMSDGHV